MPSPSNRKARFFRKMTGNHASFTLQTKRGADWFRGVSAALTAKAEDWADENRRLEQRMF